MDDDEVYNTCIGTGSFHSIDSRRARKQTPNPIGFIHHDRPGRGIEAANTSGDIRVRAGARGKPDPAVKRQPVHTRARSAKAAGAANRGGSRSGRKRK